jgi:hypothetical protein
VPKALLHLFTEKHLLFEAVLKPRANLGPPVFTDSPQLNLTAKAPNAAPETSTTVAHGATWVVLGALYNYTTRCGANKGPTFLFKHQRRGTEAAPYMAIRFLPANSRFAVNLSVLRVFTSACKADGLSNRQTPSLFAFTVNSLPLCQPTEIPQYK